MGRPTLLSHTFVIDTSTLDNLITGAHTVLGIGCCAAAFKSSAVCLAEGKEGLGNVIVYGGRKGADEWSGEIKL